MIIAKEFSFDSAHKLDWHKGKCRNLHGHTYKLQVLIQGELNEQGIVMDFKELDDKVKAVLEKLDHAYLNSIIKNPTAENLAIFIWDKLKNSLPLYEIKLWETPDSFVVYMGE